MEIKKVCSKKKILREKQQFLLQSHSEKLKKIFHDQTLGIDIYKVAFHLGLFF